MKRQLSMLESTFHEDWDEIGSNRAKKGHVLLKSTIFSKVAGCQWVNWVSVQRLRMYKLLNLNNLSPPKQIERTLNVLSDLFV